LKVAETSWKWK